MLNKRFIPFLYAQNFFGVNFKDTDENMNDGEWDGDSLNIFSDPRGALASRTGFSALTTASIGSGTAWCGFYEFQTHKTGSTTKYYIGGAEDGKVYNYASNTYTELFDGLDTTNKDDARFDFWTLDNTVMIIPGGLDSPMVWTGSGSAATFATSVTADFGLEWQRYGWLHSTVDSRLIYYCATLGDPDSAYTSFLNFDEDGYPVTGMSKQGDDMIIGKENSLYRVQYRGTEPLFKKYRLSANIGPVTHFAMKEIPGGRVVFLAHDFNFYMMDGDSVFSVGDNIKGYLKLGVKSRLKFAVSGLLYNRDQYWCSFTKTSGATQNDRTVVMDWSRPYRDIWGKLQYPWFIYTIAANCFAEVSVSGDNLLYHGGYLGLMYKNDSTTADNGVAFIASYKSKRFSLGDPTLEKKFDWFSMAYDNKGDWDLGIQFILDDNALTEKNITQNMEGGLGSQPLFDVAKFDVDSFASESDSDVTHDIGRQGKTIQLTMSTSGLDEAWVVHDYTIHAKPLRRARRTRE